MRHTATVHLTGVMVAGAMLVAGCGDDADSSSSATTAAPATTTADDTAFPIVVTADNGDVELAAPPQRIVSLSPSLTELLFAIDAGGQVVAVDQYSDYPAGTPITDLSGFQPNVEAVGGYEPDLVVVGGDRDGVVGALDALGIPTLLLSSADSLDDVYEQIDVLGAATDNPDAADALADRMRADLDEVAASVPERDEPLRYFYELSDGLHSVTSDTFIGEVLGLAGLTSIADGVDDSAGGFPQLSTEYVLDADPDVVFLAHTDGTGQDPAELAARAGWSELQAVRNDNVIVLDPDISSRWGPRVVELLQAVVDATSEIRQPVP
jgi:iron complex transport system substrate-binding protein